MNDDETPDICAYADPLWPLSMTYHPDDADPCVIPLTYDTDDAGQADVFALALHTLATRRGYPGMHAVLIDNYALCYTLS